MLNKIDLIPAERLLPLTATLTALAPFAETYMVSAANGDGLDRLSDALAEAMPEGRIFTPTMT